MGQKIFLNDELVDAQKAMVSTGDSGLLYGAGLFETMRSYGRKVFALDEHIARIAESGKKLGIQIPNSEFLADAVYETLNANNIDDAKIRLTITNGSLSHSQEKLEPTVIITTSAIQEYPSEYYKKGVLVALSPYRQNPTDPTAGHKTTSYFPRMMGLQYAHERGAAEALWFTVENYLAEGCISNVFLVKDGKLLTPQLDTPILPGIIRAKVIELAKDNDIELKEQQLTINNLLEADEVFITNSIMEIMPITGVEKHTISDGKVGVTTKLLSEKLKELIGS